ncbi:MAG: hypothetical protein QW364_01730 [Thermoplasmatales archaeon]
MLFDNILHRSDCVKIKDLEKVGDFIYNKISILSNLLIKQELSSVKRDLKQITGEHYLSEFSYNLKSRGDGSKVNSPKIDKRIMIAHPGFQKDLTKVKVEGEICLSYGMDVENIPLIFDYAY